MYLHIFHIYMQEMELMSNLRHPNIVRFLGAEPKPKP